MNKLLRMIPMFAMLMLLVMVSSLGAQSPISIKYGESAAGEITNQNFETLFSFEGSAGDVVLIEMISTGEQRLDAFLYLTTLQNDILAQNDDYDDLNSRIVARLPRDDTYQIVATRNHGREGSSEGAFALNLQKFTSAQLGTPIEGEATYETPPTSHLFVPESTGMYTITYDHLSGSYYPELEIAKIEQDSRYERITSTLNGVKLSKASVTIELEENGIYVFTVQENTRSSSNEGDTNFYIITVTEGEE